MSASWPGLSEWKRFFTQLLVLTIPSQMQAAIWSWEDCHLPLAKASLCKHSLELGACIINRGSPIALKFKAQFQLHSQEVQGSFLCLRSCCQYLVQGWQRSCRNFVPILAHCPWDQWLVVVQPWLHWGCHHFSTHWWLDSAVSNIPLWAQFLQHYSTEVQCLVSTVCISLCPLMFIIIQVDFALWK